jgi:hypothetical protein
MFEPSLFRIYELLSEQRQRARLNNVDLKVSCVLSHTCVRLSAENTVCLPRRRLFRITVRLQENQSIPGNARPSGLQTFSRVG